MENEGVTEFNLNEAADEIIANGEPSPDSAEGTPSEGQSEGNPEQTEGDKALSPEEILNQVAKEQNDPNAHKDVLEKINAMGLAHNGLPIKIDDPKLLGEIIQKGFDYTKKTMAHADEVKAKTEEFTKMETQLKEREGQIATREQEIQNTVFESQIMEDMLLEMQSGDPELFAHIAKLFSEKKNVYERQKPIQQKYEGELKQLKDEIQGIKGQKQTEELGKIKQGWDKELSDLQSKTAASLTKLGVKPNWDKVKEAWTADASNTLSVEQALYAVHGADIAKAHQSHTKLLQTKNKANLTLLNRTAVGGGQRGGSPEIKAAAGDYESILKQASANF